MTPQEKQHNPQSEKDENIRRRESRIDHELEETFPASDPPSYSQPGNTYKKPGKNKPKESSQSVEAALSETTSTDDPTLYSKPESLYKHEKEREREERINKRIDEELDQSFPASDPPSYSKPGNTYKKPNPDQ